MLSSRLFQVSLLVAGCCLLGCTFSPEQRTTRAPVTGPGAPAPVKIASKPLSNQQITRLLAEADYALSQNRLLMPIEDNAFDRFQSVLLLDPNNSSARTGLQAIAMRYIEMARTSIARGQYAQAQSHLNNARAIDASSPLLAETAALLRREQAKQPPAQTYKPGPDEHLLDAQELTRKSPAIIKQLGQLAQKAKDSGNLVLIYARNDAEGRWIYAQMRDSLEDFLLRGDIRIAPQPRVQFTPSL